MMNELIRTNEEFTSGIVNVPQNTPAQLFFICLTDNELAHAKAQFNIVGVPFDVEPKRKRTIVISKDVLNNSIVQMIIENNRELRQKKQLKRRTTFRYVFFELDTLDEAQLKYVLQVYKDYQLPVYYHRSMRGYHFLSVKPIIENLYHEAMLRLKPLNMACPHVTIRIRANKWVNEKDVFKIGNIQMQALHSDTLRLKQWIENQDFYHLKKHYLVVNYRQTGEAGNL